MKKSFFGGVRDREEIKIYPGQHLKKNSTSYKKH
jgi:hypothetical protein